MPLQSIRHHIHYTAVFAAALISIAVAGAANAADLALTHARIYPFPDAAPIADGTILIHDGRIAAIAAGATLHVPTLAARIDLRGATVMAGFWNSHVHLMSPPLLNAAKRSDAELTRELTQMLTRWGFTTVFDTASVQQVRVYAKAGGQILFGTDVGYTDVYDTTEEYRQLGRALDWRQVLTALTTAPAERFGYAKRKGRLARGMDADLVVLDADPSKDIAAFARVRLTLRGGRTIYDAKTPPVN